MATVAAQPLMEADIWALQKAYYAEQRQEAWLSVPYLFTSNRLVAKWMARLIAQMSTHFPNEKIHVIELGSGHGIYSYFMYEYLTELGVDFELTITDLVEDNIAYMQALPQWQGLPVKWCSLDIAKGMDPLVINNAPTFVIANYFFDSLPQAAYAQDQGTWAPAYVTVNQSHQAGQLNLDFSIQDKAIDCAWTRQLLAQYADAERVLIPETVFNVFAHLKQNDAPVFCIVNDKGFLHKDHFNYCKQYSYQHDGAMATMVNFDAIRQWVEALGDGYAAHAPSSVENNHLIWYVLNDADKRYQQALSLAFMGISWSDLFHLIMGYTKQSDLALNDWLSYLEIMDYDEAILERMGHYISEHLIHSPEEIETIRPALQQLRQRLYWHPSRSNAFFMLIDLMLKAGMAQEAAVELNKYREFAAIDYEFVWRLGVACYQLKQFEKASIFFEKSRKINKICPHAKKYLTLIV